MRNTCFKCPHVGLEEMVMGACAAYCTKSRLIVPFRFVSCPRMMMYTHIPLECPLPNVDKREYALPTTKWEVQFLEVVE